jgi:hypothetical protein
MWVAGGSERTHSGVQVRINITALPLPGTLPELCAGRETREKRRSIRKAT